MPSMTISMPAMKYAEFKRLFLITYPNNTAEIDPANMKWGFTPPLNDDQRIKYRTMLFLWGAYTKAKDQEYDEQNRPVLDEDIISGT